MATAHKKTVDTTDVAVDDPDRARTVQTWLNHALEFICTLLMYGITPVFVFDGEHPVEKTLTKQDRMEKKQKDATELEQYKDFVRGHHVLDRNVQMVEQLRKLMRKQNYIAGHEMEMFKTVLDGIGIPCIQARHEGEQLCALLAIEGKADAVFSTDTDTLIHGAPLLITEFVEPLAVPEGTEGPLAMFAGGTVHQVTTVALADVLQALNLSYETFVDLGIMAGCDYNKNIYNLGIGKAYKLLKQCGTIDQLPREKYDLKCLNHTRCRELFQYVRSSDMTISGTLNVRNVLGDTAREVLGHINLTKFMVRLVPLYRHLPAPKDEVTTKPPTRIRLNIVGPPKLNIIA